MFNLLTAKLSHLKVCLAIALQNFKRVNKIQIYQIEDQVFFFLLLLHELISNISANSILTRSKAG